MTGGGEIFNFNKIMTLDLPDFVHLRVHSAYSLAEGAVRLKETVGQCRRYDMPAMAVTDTNNMFGALELSLAACKEGVQPIFGMQGKIQETGSEIVFLVQDQQGYLNLSELISQAYMQSDDAAEPMIPMEHLKEHHQGLIALSGGPVKGHLEDKDLTALHQIFGDRFYIELQRHGEPGEQEGESALIGWAYKNNVPLVATNNVFYPDPDLYEAHDAFLCIAQGAYVSDDSRRRVTSQHYFKSAREMADLFSDIPEAIQNTLTIARRCHFILQPIDPILPPFECESGRDEEAELLAQAKEGLRWRLDNFVLKRLADQVADKGNRKEKIAEIEKPYWDRLDYEMGIISQMGFPGYFLIVSDFIKWSKEHNIPVGPGRGSGAGSIVAWALKITDLDPLEFGLLFERFLNPERVSMPDFDVDFCQERRDEVIAYVQDKYGHDKVAQIITFGKLQARAVVRDVGRVLQMPYGQVDRIAKLIPFNPANPVSLQEALDQDADLRAERSRDSSTRHLLDTALKLEGLYRHASTHAAGVVIGDRPLQELVPLYRDPRSDMPVTQFNMKYVEQAGLVKFDFLGLKTMTVIQKAVDMVAQKGEQIDILKVPLDDAKSYEMIAAGNTTGVFQLESGGMRDMLRKVRPDRFEEIIALVALYRPGPMDNIPTYVAIKHGEQEPDYLHPKLKPILEETFGIMIYQEQVMQAAQEIAGYTLGGADLLRRAMGKKIKEAMDAEREKFVKGAKEHSDVDAEQANFIFDQIAKFAGYGFNKSHAAAYALIAYWTAWLKANHPVEFMAASMCLDMQNTEKLAIFKQEMDRLDIRLLPPDVNQSARDFTVEDGAVRYALAALKGVGTQAMDMLVSERGENGKFASVPDLLNRISVKMMNRRQFEVLAASGAFDSVHANRAQIHAGAEMLLRFAQSNAEDKASGQESLFGGPDLGNDSLDMPDLPAIKDWNNFDKLRYEFDAVGFYLSAHPLDSRRDQLKRLGFKGYHGIQEDLAYKSAATANAGAVLLKKTEKFSSKMGKKFAILQLSDPNGVYEAMMFSDVLARVRDQLVEGEAYSVLMNAEKREDQVRFTVHDMKPLENALEGKTLRLTLCLEDVDGVAPLQELLNAHKNSGGSAQIRIRAKMNDRGEQAILLLPGHWGFNSQTRNALADISYIKEIIEE